MTARPWLSFVLGCVLLSWGCGGGGHSNPAPAIPVPSPALLPPTTGTVSDTLTLQWLIPNGSIDGYELEEKSGTGAAYQKVHTGLLPNSGSTFLVTLPAGAPEATDFYFRVRAVRGTDSSPYSNEVLYHKPLNTPSQLTGQFDWSASGVALSWTTNSTVSDGVLLKRAESTSGGTITGAWVTLDVPAGSASTYLDKSAKLDLYYVYLVVNLKGKEPSADSLASTVISTFIPSPSLLTAIYDPVHGGVSLTCTNTFSQTDGVVLERAEANASGLAVGAWVTLSTPAGALTTFLDQGVQEGLSCVYRVSNIRQSTDSLTTLSTSAVLVPPAPPSNLVAKYDINQGAVLLSWTENSIRNTGVQLERTEADASGAAINPWVILSLPGGLVSTYTDRGTQEFTSYIYRVTNLLGSTKSTVSNPSTAVATPLAVPSILSAAYDGAKGGVALAWKTNSTHTDGSIIERATCDSNGLPTTVWTTLYSYGAQTSFLDRNGVELTRYLYRVTNLSGQRPSAPSSPSALINTPLAPPSYVYAYYDSYGGAVTIYWYSSYGVNRSNKLERAESDASGTPTSGWTALPLPAGQQSSFTDKTIHESTRYVYRVANVLDQYTTPFVQSAYPVLTPLLAPTQLAATSKPGGVDLNWQNQSQAATQVVVRRTGGSYTVDVATLSASATTYSDTNLSLGTYAYRIVAKDSKGEAPSATVNGTTLNRADSLSLSSTTLSRSNASDADLRPGGAWAFAAQSPFQILSNGDPWPAIAPNTIAQLSTSILKMDSQDHPHAVFLAPSPTDSTISILKHMWYDGTSWNTEDMMQGTFPYSYYSTSFQFTLDSNGRPQALVNLSSTTYPYGGTIGSLSYIHYSAGSWKTDSLAGASNAATFPNSFTLALDGSDNPHVLVRVGSDGVELLPGGPGVWTATTLTSEPILSGSSSLLDSAWLDADNGWVFYMVSNAGTNASSSLKARQKLAGVWQDPVVIGTQDMDWNGATGQSGTSSDRSRVAVLYGTNVGLKMYHLDLTGWHETLVDAAPNNYRWYRIGFDSSNKLRILYRSQSDYTSYVALHE